MRLISLSSSRRYFDLNLKKKEERSREKGALSNFALLLSFFLSPLTWKYGSNKKYKISF
jgi:hypothetical protein